MHSRCNLYYINLMAQQGFFEKGHFLEKLTLFVSFLSAKRNFFCVFAPSIFKNIPNLHF